MGFTEQDLLSWFTQYAYQPILIYLAIFILMLASGFGLPAPEEFTLVSAGLVCYIASRPDLYPPPYVGATPVNAYVTAGVAFFSVIFSDCLVFFLGRRFGGQFLRSRYTARFRARMDDVAKWTKKYGMWAAGAFRFTPGLRFPGHFACGMMGLSTTKFVLVDAAAAGISVPTQVLLVAFYGETILIYFKQFKIVLAVILLAVGIYYLARWLRRRSSTKKSLQTPPVA
ncbi:MAG: VTT domain-containing protein [Pseudobdellovibrionaceae bacterium]|uniref:DedA family protein n=1 Tax=Oligoflexus sp. TaxID=1971216 RepID=UPI0027C8BBFF|nr:VTT domain-containing protein [Oligoflexus sp.]MDQ3235766.1 VTT domain-containing protein [Pseudobdellovibrionaceae bacterium]HYX39144.1 VTT domain-containing protein [Oligoflexus sp.]